MCRAAISVLEVTGWEVLPGLNEGMDRHEEVTLVYTDDTTQETRMGGSE